MLSLFGSQPHDASESIEENPVEENAVEKNPADAVPTQPTFAAKSNPPLDQQAVKKSTPTSSVARPREKIAEPQKRQVDWAGALNSVGDNPELLRELVQLFLAALPESIANLKNAVRCRNGKQLKAAAHTLKGSLLFLHTKDPYQNAFKLEQFGTQNKLDECKVVFEILRRDLNSLSEELNWYLESNVAQETET